MIISIYLNKYNITDPDIISKFSINHIMSILRRPLNINNHGKFNSMNKYITDIYKQHGRILLNKKNIIAKKDIPVNLIEQPVDVNDPAFEGHMTVNNIIAKKYMGPRGEVILTRLLSILIHNYCIYNNLTTHEYCYYDLIIKRGLTKSDATKLLNELINKANSVKSI